jgi:hypothetical protein
MESKTHCRSPTRDGQKLDKSEEGSRLLVRSSSFKVKDVRGDSSSTIDRRTDHAADAKPEPKGGSDIKDEKSSRRVQSHNNAIELIQEEKIDSEFEELMRKPNGGGEIAVSDEPEALLKMSGFKMLVSCLESDRSFETSFLFFCSQ